MSTSPYHPLRSSEGQIRLLILDPATQHEAPIQCQLQPVLLSSNPYYEALSYTWGDRGQGCNISLSNHEFRIGDNAAAALRRLRDRMKRRTLWIDAICINQADASERNEQVVLMQQIYGKAQNVIVWLGELTDGGLQGIRLIQNKLLSVGWEQWKIERRYGKVTLPFMENFGRSVSMVNKASLVEEQFNGEVRELLDRPWWRRTWIIQEAVLAKQIQIMCGAETISWESIDSLFKRLRWTQAQIQIFGVHLSERDIFPEQAYRLIDDYRNRWHSPAGRGALLEILYRFRNLDCTDAHDRIYGFLGIVQPDIAAAIAPDYNAKVHSVLEQSRYYDIHALITDGPGSLPRRGWARLPNGWERIPKGKTSLFRDHNNIQLYITSPLEGQAPAAAEYYLEQRNLPIGWSKSWDNLGRVKVGYGIHETTHEQKLRLERESLRSEYSTMPCWVPNWDCLTQWDPEPLIDFSSPHSQYYASANTNPDIKASDDPGTLKLTGGIINEIHQLGPAWHPEVDRPPISRKGIDALIQWETLGLTEVPDCPYSESGGRVNALWRTMIADYAGNKAASSDDWAYVETWYDRVGWNRDFPNLTSKGIWQKVKLEQDIRKLEVAMLAHLLSIMSIADFNFLEWKTRYGNCIKRIYKACAHRALLVSSRGFLGLAPWNARPGDKVAILYGGATPCILRKIQGSEDFQLVGEAYVYGLMAGEGLSNVLNPSRGSQVLNIQ